MMGSLASGLEMVRRHAGIGHSSSAERSATAVSWEMKRKARLSAAQHSE
jgi:hypothetical protein